MWEGSETESILIVRESKTARHLQPNQLLYHFLSQGWVKEEEYSGPGQLFALIYHWNYVVLEASDQKMANREKMKALPDFWL